MTDAEFHQQQLEHQQWMEEMEAVAKGMSLNHAQFVGAVRFIRDNARGERDIQDAIKYLLRALEEYEQLNRRMI